MGCSSPALHRTSLKPPNHDTKTFSAAAGPAKTPPGHALTPLVPPTFQEGVGSDGEEGQLQKGLAVDEGLEPLGGLQHHGVPEGSGILLQQVCQLEKHTAMVSRH